jgi:phosphatidylglycerol---prolipoprotein diacylglyceryl transferase
MELAAFFWDPAREMLPFNLPLLDRPILWYGFLYALGFLLSYFALYFLLKKISSFAKEAKAFAERITFYAVMGTVIGARLGDILFYQNLSHLSQDPLMVIRVWEGGLASHGGVVGILAALYLLSRKKNAFCSFVALLDLVAASSGLAACSIRIGNFINQEILGTPTQVPWAVVFGHPADGSYPTARHPVQLYEAGFYLLVFCLLFFLWYRGPFFRQPGKMSGLFLMLVFSFRFFIEFFKEEQSYWLHTFSTSLSMGQYLSVPLIALGSYLFFNQRLTMRSIEGE